MADERITRINVAGDAYECGSLTTTQLLGDGIHQLLLHIEADDHLQAAGGVLGCVCAELSARVGIEMTLTLLEALRGYYGRTISPHLRAKAEAANRQFASEYAAHPARTANAKPH